MLAGACGAAIAASVLVGQGEASRAAGRPTDDQVVLDRVPPRSAADAAERPLRARLERDPRDAGAAAALARLAISRARREADPRQLGRAQAALQPWWHQPAPPAEVQLLRAIIRQARHDWQGALADLDALVARAPDDVEAHLVRATVLAVRGRYTEAGASCAALAGLASRLATAACQLPLELGQGRAREGIAALEAAVAEGRPQELAWGHALLGEARYWRGDDAAAERHLRLALGADPGDRYTRGVLADLLLEGGRLDEAVALLEGHQSDEALLLRLAIAETRRGRARGAALAGELRARFAAEARRGDEVHGREEARLLLALDHDPDRALARARANWAQQREPWDARILLEAARAAGRPAAAADALAWPGTGPGGWQRLAPLARALAEASR
jgi:predicted Zn-dependent protease